MLQLIALTGHHNTVRTTEYNCFQVFLHLNNCIKSGQSLLFDTFLSTSVSDFDFVAHSKSITSYMLIEKHDQRPGIPANSSENESFNPTGILLTEHL